MLPDRWWARGLAGLRPDPRWLQFRQETAYGGDGLNAIKPDDLVDFLEWRRTFPSG